MDRTLQFYDVLQYSTVEVAHSEKMYSGRSIAGLLGDGSGDGNSQASYNFHMRKTLSNITFVMSEVLLFSG